MIVIAIVSSLQSQCVRCQRTFAESGKGKLHSYLCLQEKVGLGSSAESGKGKSKMSKNISHGYHLVKGKAGHPMEDYVVAQFKQVDDNELGLFAIFDGHLSHEIPNYLKSHLFETILNEVKCAIPYLILNNFEALF